ncbi:sodium-dependent transporter [Ammoniphilus sp. CFH 90114]|uniref:sodium-dependent transporter n=1 Tax=Ammoniphilus sp. CFH 90114 TaxID=2493665 RepID=UPI00100EFEB8|nr:sodium-dependent transporter [Ammoniphilus sp. CFH 90114]RXT06386.1 sodium-dependent transporter [Ammoniphilus sp. CFH 90114]
MNTTEQWSSKLGFILAAAGSAIGLGAIWKFPYVAGTSGGGAFFLLFLLFTIFLGLPLLLGEFIIGRSTQREAISAYQTLAPGSAWHLVGRMGVVTNFILLSFYSVVGGWVISYFYRSITGQLLGTEGGYEQLFGRVISSPVEALGAQFVFIFITCIVVARGVQQGIEKTSKYMMPALFILFIILIFRSLTLEGAWKGITFFLYPDFSKITAEAILYALGQSFFSLSIGASVMVTYSSYLSKKESLTRSATSIVGLNLFISLLAGLAIFPAVFSLNLEPAGGPGLLFNVLPSVFEKIPFGAWFIMAFLALFLFATLTSAFSMLEIIVASITKGNEKLRKKWSWIIGIAIYMLGIPSALSFGPLGEFTVAGKSIFDTADYLVSNILLPLGALFISIFVSFKIKPEILRTELDAGRSVSLTFYKVWLTLLRYLVPLAIIVVFLHALEIL